MLVIVLDYSFKWLTWLPLVQRSNLNEPLYTHNPLGCRPRTLTDINIADSVESYKQWKRKVDVPIGGGYLTVLFFVKYLAL